MAAKPPITLGELCKYPRMTNWFRPVLLSKLLLKVIIYDLFGQYADRRLIVAALDTVTPQALSNRTKLARCRHQPARSDFRRMNAWRSRQS